MYVIFEASVQVSGLQQTRCTLKHSAAGAPSSASCIACGAGTYSSTPGECCALRQAGSVVLRTEGLCDAKGGVEMHACEDDGDIPTRHGVMWMSGAFKDASVGTMMRLFVGRRCIGSP